MQRVLIVACIIAALVLSAFKPARGDSIAAEHCATTADGLGHYFTMPPSSRVRR